LASDAAGITVPILLWRRLLRELRRCGDGRRESGAFLLRARGAADDRIARFICYDDLDPASCQSGAIAFHAKGYAALWAYCREKAVEVVADVHTHPGLQVGQSDIDQRHPMVPVVGHTAMILPNFADAPWWSLEKVGVYEYLGNFTWRAHSPTKSQRRVRLTLW
jgi:proteasome lid subunit RPN8/RPN11